MNVRELVVILAEADLDGEVRIRPGGAYGCDSIEVDGQGNLIIEGGGLMWAEKSHYRRRRDDVGGI